MRKIIVLVGFTLSLALTNSIGAEGDIEPEFEGNEPPGGRVPGGTRHKPAYSRALNFSRSLGTRQRYFVENSSILTILSPQGIGYTISKQPRLYWHLSKIVENPVIVTITYVDPLEKEGTRPIFKMPIQVSHTGIQVFDLSKYNIELEIGLKYQWSITVSTGDGDDLKKFMSSSTIQRVEPADELVEKVNHVEEKEKPSVYAKAGLWYDAISSLSDLIEKYPTDKTLQSQRSDLLEQVGLGNIVE